MKFKMLGLALSLTAAFGLMACGDDSSSASDNKLPEKVKTLEEATKLDCNADLKCQMVFVEEENIKDYFEARLALLEPVFPIACHRLGEGPDFSMDFNYRPPQTIPEGKHCFSPTLKCDILNINNLFFEENLNKLHHVY